MDEHRLDKVARRLASAGPRRPLFGALAGTVTTLLVGERVAEAACKKVGRKCDKNKDCCNHATCKGDKKDKKGKCRCKGGFTSCNKQCYDLDKDEQHCGACGNACISPNKCCDGECNTLCAQ
jgi:hypothetical protein